MFRIVLLALLVLASCQPRIASKKSSAKPKLVVGIVVDQMRYEYLNRFYDQYGTGGFRRLMDQGYNFKNTHYNYSNTATGPGHASIYTGSTPRYHGIIGNDWYSNDKGKSVYCAEDLSVTAVGGGAKEGNRSPDHLLATTITDELKICTRDQAKVIGISIKDRGAIMPAGHYPDGAYWYSKDTEGFMTSSYYQQDLPDWVAQFNVKKLPESYSQLEWSTDLPIDEMTQSDDDHAEYEFSIASNGNPTFAYDMDSLRSSSTVITTTPYGNTYLAEFAKSAVLGEQLGQDLVTDFLAISFSSTDYIGHHYGPMSKEIQDTYVKLDNDLADFFSFLDHEVGANNWVVFLTADHGASEVPKYLMNRKIKAGYFSKSTLISDLNMHLLEVFNQEGLALVETNEQVYLNHTKIKDSGLKLLDVKKVVKEYLVGLEGMRHVVFSEDLIGNSSVHFDMMMLGETTHPRRCGDVIFVLESGWIDDHYRKGGTSHGTMYTYDTHIPLLFYGKDINKGSTITRHNIIDIAPTLSFMLDIKLPNSTIGSPLQEILAD